MIPHLRRNWRFWAGLLLGVASLVALVVTVDRHQLVATMRSANYFFLVPAVAFYFTGQYARSWRWSYILRPMADIRPVRIFPVMNIGYMANNILPSRIGEFVRVSLLARRERRVAVPAVTATVMIERTYDGLVLVSLGAFCLPVLAMTTEFGNSQVAIRGLLIGLSVVLTTAIVATLVVLTLLAGKRRLQLLVIRGARLAPSRFRRRAVRAAAHFLHGIRLLDSPQKHGAILCQTLVIYGLELGVYTIVGFSFGIHEHFSNFALVILTFALVMAVSNLATAVPVSAGGIGPFEVAAQQTLVAVGVAAPVATSYAVTVHLAALWLPVNVVGLFFIARMNWSMRRHLRASGENPRAMEVR